MSGWNFETTEFEGLVVVSPFIAEDERGAFIKDYSQETFTKNGYEHQLSEVFYTVSHKGTVRAIHFQREKKQAKLVRCISGKIFDVLVDLRKGSSSFGKYLGFELSGTNGKELLIPGCYGHGYLVLEPSIVSYKCNEKFYGEYDDGIVWNDPDINIDWPIDKVGEIILSDKDKNLQTLEQFKKLYGGL